MIPVHLSSTFQLMTTLVRQFVTPFIKNPVAWNVLNRTVLRLARKMDFWRRCHVEGRAGVVDEFQKDFADGVVRNGVFSGMRYPSVEAAGSAIYPKLLGSYESELHPLMQRIVETGYSTIVDIGCAEGYYANGLAMRIPQAMVYAFDLEPRARELCAEMAEANGVDARVLIREACTPEVLAGMPLGTKALIISDCEGYEHDLFTPASVAALKRHDVLIEVHAFVNPDIPVRLRQRFRETHAIASIPTIDDADKPARYPWRDLDRYTPEQQQLLLMEGRPAGMEWLWMTPADAPRGPQG
jgi:precorrin-6B methylase 2